METIKKIVRLLMPHGPFDAIGVGIIDFNKLSFSATEANCFEGELKFSAEPFLYFDLASLTKPLTNSLTYFLEPQSFNEELLLCLNHRGGLPAWGLLPNKGWREQILKYSISESETLYSDFSSLRVMLELQKKSLNQKNICSEIWDKETLFWTDLPSHFPVVQCGYKNSRPNYGQVHDPNAWVIKDFCTHAGLFSTIDGLCRTLVNYQKQTDFISKVKANLQIHDHRFSYGWDRVVNSENTLAGNGCGPFTFGHLGFTGTSIWIDPDKMLGHVILSNAVKRHWYDKSILNEIRKIIGMEVWGQEPK
jgi:hypothetical protein